MGRSANMMQLGHLKDQFKQQQRVRQFYQACNDFDKREYVSQVRAKKEFNIWILEIQGHKKL